MSVKVLGMGRARRPARKMHLRLVLAQRLCSLAQRAGSAKSLKGSSFMHMSTLIVLVVLGVLLFGGGGGYYWSRRR